MSNSCGLWVNGLKRSPSAFANWAAPTVYVAPASTRWTLSVYPEEMKPGFTSNLTLVHALASRFEITNWLPLKDTFALMSRVSGVVDVVDVDDGELEVLEDDGVVDVDDGELEVLEDDGGVSSFVHDREQENAMMPTSTRVTTTTAGLSGCFLLDPSCASTPHPLA